MCVHVTRHVCLKQGECVWKKASVCGKRQVCVEKGKCVWKKVIVCGKDESESISNQLINALLQQLHML